MLRFRLRTLLVVVTLLSIVAAGLAWWLHADRMRKAGVAKIKEHKGKFVRDQESKRIVRIYLSGTRIDDAVLDTLCGYLVYFPQLVELDLVGANISDEGLEGLTQLTQLKELYLFETPITDEGIQVLKERLPNLVIKNEQPAPIASGMASINIYRHAITALAGAPNESQWATGNGSGFIFLWDLEKIEPVKKWAAHQAWVFDVAYSPDGALIATGGDNVVKLWEQSEQELIRVFEGPRDDVHDVAFTPDGNYLIAASDDRQIRIWKVDTGEQVATLSGHKRQIPRMALSPDGKMLASASRDKTVRLWSIPAGDSIGLLTGHQSDVMTVVFHENGELLASGDESGVVRLWNVQTLQLIQACETMHDRVFDLAFNAKNRTLVAGGTGGVEVWDLVSGIPRSSARQSVVSRLSFNARETCLLSTNIAGELRMLDPTTLETQRIFPTMYGARGLPFVD